MVVVRIIVKIVLLPVRICLTMIQLSGYVLHRLSATVFHILSGIICIVGSFRYDLTETGTEAVRMGPGQVFIGILPVLFWLAAVWLETIKIRLMK